MSDFTHSNFTPQQQRLLDGLAAQDRSERDRGIRNADSMKAIAPDVAQLLYTLIVATRAQSIVEFGTSHGYSTIYLATAAERTGGHVYSIDELEAKTVIARAHLETAALDERVTLMTGDGAGSIASLPDPIDFVLVDVPVQTLTAALPTLLKRMGPGGTIFVDGGPAGHWQTADGLAFASELESHPAWVTTYLPMQKTHLLAVRDR